MVSCNKKGSGNTDIEQGTDSGGESGITSSNPAVSTEPPFDYTPDGEFKYAKELAAIWSGNIVYDEYVMFLGKNDVVPLLYPATEIISVKSTDGKKTFTEGVDYELVDGKLIMPEGSSLTYIPEETYWAKGVYDVYTYRDGKKHITYAAGLDGMAKYQVAVTYKHESTSPIEVPDCSETFKNFIKKLERGEDVTIIFNGDSITEGWDSSIRSSYAPYMPHWPALLTHYLAYTYGYTIRYTQNPLEGVFNYPKAKEVYGDRGTINYVNTAVGGWQTSHGFSNLEKYCLNLANKYGGCDLFFYAYGMNNQGTHPADFSFAVEKTIRKFVEKYPDAPIVLVSSMLPNTESVDGVHFLPKQEGELIKIRDELKAEGVMIEVAPMTSVHTYMCSVKRFRDHSGNNMNHPGDYTHRVYAQVALQTILGYADN
jgi:hypothetical protein